MRRQQFRVLKGNGMSDQKFKADAGKAKPDLLFMGFARSLRLVQATLEYGAQKYEEHSWRQVPNGEDRYFRAGERHHQERLIGAAGQFTPTIEFCDHESGLPHIAHEVFNLLCLMELALQNSNDPDALLKQLCQFNPPPTAHKEA
jgi:Domain of unknown function (DUF5664)